MRLDLTVSIISADNRDLLLPCLRSLFETTRGITLEVYVVDNASTDDSFSAVEAAYPGVKVIRNSSRQGFSTNNNIVLNQGQGRYLMLLNDDTIVLDGALDRMVRFMDAHPRAGAVGAFLSNPDGSFQPAFARFPHPLIEALWPSTNWSHLLRRHGDGPLQVDSVCGAAMLVRREVIDQVGVLDTAFDPIYSEEVDWCYRIKLGGWHIYTLPEARIVHYGGQTMNRMMPRKYHLLLSHKKLFFQKHAGKRAAEIYGTTLWAATVIKLVWWTLVGFAREDHQVAREKKHLHRCTLSRFALL